MYTTKFMVSALADPATIARVINPLAQLALIPGSILAETCGETTQIVIRQPGLSEAEEQAIARKMISCVLVEEVIVTREPRLMSGEVPA